MKATLAVVAHRGERVLADDLARVVRRTASRHGGVDVTVSLDPAAVASRGSVVLLASPDAARDPGVDAALRAWRGAHPGVAPLPVVVSGTWLWDEAAGGFSARSDAVPPALRDAYGSEPRHLDLAWAAAGVSRRDRRRDPRWVAAAADVVAPLCGVPKDQLVGDDVTRRRRSRRRSRVALTAVAVLAVVAVGAAVVAAGQARRAEELRRDATAEGLAQQATALAWSEPRLAARLATQAWATDRSTATRGALVAVGDAVGSTETAAWDLDPLVAGARREGDGAVVTLHVDGTLSLVEPGAPRSDGWPAPATVASVPGRVDPAARLQFDDAGMLWAVDADAGRLYRWASGLAVEPTSVAVELDAATAWAMAGDGSTLVVAGADGSLRWLDPRTGRPDGRAPAPSDIGAVTLLAPSADGSTVAAASVDRVAIVPVGGEAPDVVSGTVASEGEQLTALAWSGAGDALAALDSAGRLSRLDRGARPTSSVDLGVAGAVPRQVVPYLDEAFTVAGSLGKVSLVGGSDLEVLFRGPVPARGTSFLLSGAATEPTVAILGANGSVAWANLARPANLGRDHDTALVSDVGGEVRDGAVGFATGDGLGEMDVGAWDVAAGEPRWTVPVAGHAVDDVSMLDDGSVVALVRDGDDEAGLVVVARDRPARTVPMDPTLGSFRDAQPTPGGGLLVLQARGLSELPGPGSASLRVVRRSGAADLAAMAVAPTGRLATSDLVGRVEVRDTPADPEPVAVVEAGVVATAMALDGSGNVLALATDGVLRTYDASTGTLSGPAFVDPSTDAAAVSALAFTADGALLLAGGAGGTLQIWDRDAAAPLGAGVRLTGALLEAVAHDPASDLVVASNGAFRVFDVDLDPDRTAAGLCGTAGTITRGEWAVHLPDDDYDPACA